MDTYPLLTAEGVVWAFEVETAFVSPRVIGRLLAVVDGVDEVRPRRAFSRFEDVHVQFRYYGKPYVVSEPFGDNSRYWIGPRDKGENAADARPLELALRSYRPSVWRAVAGELLTLRSVARLARWLAGR
jgi:hypothetical protein